MKRQILKIRNSFLKARVNLFVDTVLEKVYKGDKTIDILDLGGGTGVFWQFIPNDLYENINIYIADITNNHKSKIENYGYQFILLDEGSLQNFKENQFDIVVCNSVIEHVTIDKNEVWSVRNSQIFRKMAEHHQFEFARDIIRISKNYFVQTPNKHFPFELHTWLPFIQYIPRKFLIRFIKLTNKFWIKKTSPDWNLLTVKKMKQLFSTATIISEKCCGLKKSIIAYYLEQN